MSDASSRFRLNDACLVLSALLLSACQTPLTCGAVGEPCCGLQCASPLLECNSNGEAMVCERIAVSNPGGCDLVTNDGCGSGQACRQRSDGTGGFTQGCFPAGSGGNRASCGDNDDCRAGFYCNSYTKSCLSYCYADRGCASGQLCYGDGVSVGLCVPPDNCDIFTNRGCAITDICRPLILQDGSLMTLCEVDAEPSVSAYYACDFDNECPAGFACGEYLGDTFCQQFCNPSVRCPIEYVCTDQPSTDAYGLCSY